MKKSRPTSPPIPHTHAAGMERRHAASTLQPWLDHATPRVCRRHRARRCHGQNSVPSARKRCCQRVSMPSGRGDARSRRSAASMVVTVTRSMAPVRQATPKRALRPPSGRHRRCERHPPQTAMISKKNLVVDLPLRVLVELGAVGRCALAESCQTAARSNGGIEQSENRFFAVFDSDAPLLLRSTSSTCRKSAPRRLHQPLAGGLNGRPRTRRELELVLGVARVMLRVVWVEVSPPVEHSDMRRADTGGCAGQPAAASISPSVSGSSRALPAARQTRRRSCADAAAQVGEGRLGLTTTRRSARSELETSS